MQQVQTQAYSTGRQGAASPAGTVLAKGTVPKTGYYRIRTYAGVDSASDTLGKVTLQIAGGTSWQIPTSPNVAQPQVMGVFDNVYLPQDATVSLFLNAAAAVGTFWQAHLILEFLSEP